MTPWQRLKNLWRIGEIPKNAIMIYPALREVAQTDEPLNVGATPQKLATIVELQEDNDFEKES